MDLKERARLMYDFTLFIGMAIVHMIEALVLTLIPRRYRAKSIRGEIALVTGGASGIGRLIAIKLAELGAHVVIWDINKAGEFFILNLREKLIKWSDANSRGTRNFSLFYLLSLSLSLAIFLLDKIRKAEKFRVRFEH